MKNYLRSAVFRLHSSSCGLEVGIFASHIVWLARTRKLRKGAAANGKTFDDIAAEHEALGLPFKFAERKRKGAGVAPTDVEKAPVPVREPGDGEGQVLGPSEDDCDTPRIEKL